MATMGAAERAGDEAVPSDEPRPTRQPLPRAMRPIRVEGGDMEDAGDEEAPDQRADNSVMAEVPQE
jgi:hypothetical protein